MSVWIAGLVALGAIAATYFSCVRPQLRNRGGCGVAGGRARNDADLDRQIAELREELRVESGREPRGADPAPGVGTAPSNATRTPWPEKPPME